MKYDFDTPVNRFGTDSMKWDIKENELPMWVADMDFMAAPQIRAALAKRVEHGVFGYSVIPDAWHDAYIRWWERRHRFTMEKDWLMFCTGVVPAISSTVRKLTTPNENVVIQTPVYNIFFNSIVNNGCRVLESPLVYKEGGYSIDFKDLEEKLSDPQTSLMILCNPHNPVGKIWTKEELAKIGMLCQKHHVTVISDEIHCDIVMPGKEYIPFASVSEVCRDISITCMAATKAFNLAGMQSAAISVPNPVLRHKVWRAINTDEVAEPNSFAAIAAITAFNEGEEWLDSLREYVAENRRVAEEYIKFNIPKLFAVPAEATYLMWIDCGKVTEDSETFADELRAATGLFVCDGMEYGRAGKTFLRMNIACPRSYVLDGMKRLETFVNSR